MNMRRRTNKATKQRGASLVEFALVAPLLILLLFGIIESGWAFSHQLEVRHGAREGARLVAVNFGTDAQVTAEVCTRMNFTGDLATTTVTITKSGSAIGDTATVTIDAPYTSITGFTSGLFGSVTLTSSVDIRLEQIPQAGLGSGAAVTCP